MSDDLLLILHILLPFISGDNCEIELLLKLKIFENFNWLFEFIFIFDLLIRFELSSIEESDTFFILL